MLHGFKCNFKCPYIFQKYQIIFSWYRSAEVPLQTMFSRRNAWNLRVLICNLFRAGVPRALWTTYIRSVIPAVSCPHCIKLYFIVQGCGRLLLAPLLHGRCPPHPGSSIEYGVLVFSWMFSIPTVLTCLLIRGLACCRILCRQGKPFQQLEDIIIQIRCPGLRICT